MLLVASNLDQLVASNRDQLLASNLDQTVQLTLKKLAIPRLPFDLLEEKSGISSTLIDTKAIEGSESRQLNEEGTEALRSRKIILILCHHYCLG